MTVITVSRELGSEGDRIAERLVAELGYRWVDKGLLTQMAQEAGMDEEAVLALERSIPNRARFTSTDMRSLYSKQPGAWEKKSVLDDETYRRIVRETMERYAAEGDVIIIGRGGQTVLRDHPAVLACPPVCACGAACGNVWRRGRASRSRTPRAGSRLRTRRSGCSSASCTTTPTGKTRNTTT